LYIYIYLGGIPAFPRPSQKSRHSSIPVIRQQDQQSHYFAKFSSIVLILSKSYPHSYRHRSTCTGHIEHCNLLSMPNSDTPATPYCSSAKLSPADPTQQGEGGTGDRLGRHYPPFKPASPDGGRSERTGLGIGKNYAKQNASHLGSPSGSPGHGLNSQSPLEDERARASVSTTGFIQMQYDSPNYNVGGPFDLDLDDFATIPPEVEQSSDGRQHGMIEDKPLPPLPTSDHQSLPEGSILQRVLSSRSEDTEEAQPCVSPGSLAAISAREAQDGKKKGKTGTVPKWRKIFGSPRRFRRGHEKEPSGDRSDAVSTEVSRSRDGGSNSLSGPRSAVRVSPHRGPLGPQGILPAQRSVEPSNQSSSFSSHRFHKPLPSTPSAESTELSVSDPTMRAPRELESLTTTAAPTAPPSFEAPLPKGSKVLYDLESEETQP
jgi:hypothetical protein